MLCERLSGAAVAQSATMSAAAASAPVRMYESLMIMAYPCFPPYAQRPHSVPRASCFVSRSVRSGGSGRGAVGVNRGLARRFQFDLNFQELRAGAPNAGCPRYRRYTKV